MGLKSTQQLNVQYEKIWWIPPTSFGLAAFELYLWNRASQANVWLWLSIGAGAGVGSIIAVVIHRKIRK